MSKKFLETFPRRWKEIRAWSTESIFTHLRRLSGSGRMCSGINFRAVQAGIYTGNGLKNLQRMFGMLDVPPPVNKVSYNDQRFGA